MARVKVYSWQTYVRNAPDHGQVRAIAAATSVAECASRVGGCRTDLFNIGETGNDTEIATALAHPGAVLVRPILSYNAPFRVWSKGTAWDDMTQVTSDPLNA